jgi:predicted MFS family arabinose efflux permease
MIAGEGHGATSRAYRFYVMLVLGLIYVVSSIDRMMISTVAELIKHDFHLTDTQLGVLVGLFFAISFSICGIPIGVLVDRVNRTRLLATLVLLWSGLTLLSGLARSYSMLALARIGVGASESGASPASMSLIGDFFPKHQRGRALSFFYVSTPIGVAIGLMLGGTLAAHYGWRGVFLIAGIPGMILAILLFTTVREPIRGAFERPDPGEQVARPGFGAVLTAYRDTPALWMLTLAGVLLVIAQAGGTAFVTPFLMRVHGVSIQQAGAALGLAQLGPGVAGVLIGGVIADIMARQTTGGGPIAMSIVMASNFPVAALAYLVPDWHLAVCLLGLHYFLLATYYGTFFSTYLGLSPVALRGTLSAILAVIMTLMGYGLGPVAAGAASDLYHHAGATQPLRWAQVTLAGLFVLSGLCFLAAGLSIRHRTRSV